MNRKNLSLLNKNMVATSKSRNKVISCSTPEHETESPSRDSDSICDSEAASPVPFLCTQDGTEGETDVVWNYYTPRAEQAATSRLKNSTPLSRKAKKNIKRTIIDRPLPRRRNFRSTQKKSEIFQDLIELNQNLLKLNAEKPLHGQGSSEKHASGSEEDLFSNSSDCSPKSGLKTNSRCLRKNLLSSKFNKPDFEMALESDDSMNECLIKASQIVEDNILQPAVPSRHSNINNFQDSMDGFLNNIELDAPVVSRLTKTESPSLNNDSFDNFVSNLNDSVLERLTQMPIKNVTPVRQNQCTNNNMNTSGWVLQELKLHESPSKNSSFGRHSSMPESPLVSVVNEAKPSTSGMKFGRYSSMPLDSGDSPIRCTPDEIRKKHLQAREKLLAKRNLPFTSNCTQNVTAPKKPCFQPKLPSSTLPANNQLNREPSKTQNFNKSDEVDLKKTIEKKRQEALMKLRRKQSR